MTEKSKNQEIAIKLTNVKKMYKLGQIGGGTLRADLESWWAKKRGLEDPNTKIGEQRLVGKTFMALNGIDLEVYKGEALGIIGGNGAGKSTMLKLLSRVTAPTSGKIQIWGRIASMLEVGTGFNGEMTGRENVYMNGAILGMTKEEIDAKMEDIIEFSEVRDFIDTPVKRYSSGMYVKLAFSVAAHLDSEIMIMDEVLAVGDMAFQKKCLDKMRDAAKKEGRTVLYVSHNMNTIRQLCDRCVVLDKGKVIFNGDTDSAIEVYSGAVEESDLKVEYMLDEYIRPFGLGEIARIKCLSFLEKEKAEFYNHEIMKIAIEVSSKKKIDKISIAIIVKDRSNSKIWISGISKTVKIWPIENNSIILSVPISMLEVDHYMLHMELIAFDDSGNGVVYDNPFRSFVFQVKKENDNYYWPSKYYGNVRISGISAINMSDEPKQDRLE